MSVVDFVLRWRNDPVAFARECLGSAPTEQQLKILSAVGQPNAHVAVKSGHGTGKSTVLSWLVLWALVCFDDVKVACTAPTGHQLEDVLISEIEKWRSRMMDPWKSSIKTNSEGVKVVGCRGFAAMRTARKENPDALQGFHATDLMLFLIDEASGVHEKVFEVGKGSLSTPGARIVMTGNPTRSNGYFWNAFNKSGVKWDQLTLSCVDSPLVSKEYIEDMKNEYGEDSDIFRVRVLGDFPRGGDLQFISTSLVEEASKRYYDESVYSSSPLLLGVDVANFGGDKSVIYLRHGLHARRIFTAQGKDDRWLMQYANVIAGKEDEHVADAVLVDGIGIGAGVVSRLHQLGRKPINVNYAHASESSVYHNKRAECWGLMRDWLRDGGWIPNDPRLKEDLTAPEYSFTSSGKIILERKEDMRKRGLPSPDDADALAMTFAEPVLSSRKRGSVGLISAPSNYGDEWDPFHELNHHNRLRRYT